MHNAAGKIIGLILGITGFLFLFKIIFIANVPPADELAPGIVLFASIVSGLLFAFLGSKTQSYFKKKRKSENF